MYFRQASECSTSCLIFTFSGATWEQVTELENSGWPDSRAPSLTIPTLPPTKWYAQKMENFPQHEILKHFAQYLPGSFTSVSVSRLGSSFFLQLLFRTYNLSLWMLLISLTNKHMIPKLSYLLHFLVYFLQLPFWKTKTKPKTSYTSYAISIFYVPTSEEFESNLRSLFKLASKQC